VQDKGRSAAAAAESLAMEEFGGQKDNRSGQLSFPWTLKLGKPKGSGSVGCNNRRPQDGVIWDAAGKELRKDVGGVRRRRNMGKYELYKREKLYI